MCPSQWLPLGVILVICFLWPSAVEARCGHPELPYMAQLASIHFETYGYFEEGQHARVICENGLIGYPHSSPAGNYTDSIDPDGFMVVDSVALIACHNSRWNATELRCLHKADLDSQNAQVKWKHVEAVRQLDALLDHNGLSCLDIDLAGENLEQHETVLFRVRLQGEPARIPRVVLMMKNAQVASNQTNITLLEDLIMDANEAASLSDTAEGNVEVEEAKRFLDFVYETEFQSKVNHTGPVKMMLLGENHRDGSDRKHKVFRTANHEIHVSVLLEPLEAKATPRECYFNEDAAIAHPDNTSTELLIFDCQLDVSREEEETDKSDLIWVRLDIVKLNDRIGSNGTDSNAIQTAVGSMLQLCGLEAFAVSEGRNCGKPYVPIYGLVTQMQVENGVNTAQYTCMTGYRAVNLSATTEQVNQYSAMMPSGAQATSDDGKTLPTMQRFCDSATQKWQPDMGEEIFCEPVNSCRHAPPMVDPKKFFYEYNKLDNLKRAIGGQSMATLRCLVLSDFVLPYTLLKCDAASGQWVRLGKKNDTQPVCHPSLLSRGSRRGRYHHRYYHYHQNETPVNRTTIILFGRHLDDNKCLIYYGAAGLIVLFGGCFIILFHVRRMAKKISRQMRERSYMAAERGVSDSFLPVSAGMDGTSYYNDSYDSATLFSNDLPPPATPISMPTSGLEKNDYKDKSGNNLSAGFDSIKF